MNVKGLRVLYHLEQSVWWAESPDVAGFSAAADSLSEVRRQVRDALRDVMAGAPHYLVEIGGSSAMPDIGRAENRQRPARPEVGNAGSLLAAV